MSRADCGAALADANLSLPERGYLFHVGGNEWYKNRMGVLEIYKAYARRTAAPLPLWMVGAPPNEALRAAAQRIDCEGGIRFLTRLADDQLCAVYSLLACFSFPAWRKGSDGPSLRRWPAGAWCSPPTGRP